MAIGAWRLAIGSCRLAMGTLALVALAGCPARPAANPPIDPLAIAAWHGQPQAVAAVLYLTSIDPQGERTSVTLHLWHAADGRTRILMTKVDHEVLSALIGSDGAFIAYAPRTDRSTSGELADPQLPAGLAELRLLISEVIDGPLPQGFVATGADEQPQILTGRSGSFQAQITVDAHSAEVREKSLILPDGRLAYQLRYSQYRAFDGLHRPYKVEATASDGSTVIAYLRRFDALGDISAERMRLTIPASAQAVVPANFLEHLDQ